MRTTTAAPVSLQTLSRLRADFPQFAAHCLEIRTKSGAIRPLMLNRAQRQVHALLEAQRARTGKVRALILKARQQGFRPTSAGASITARR